MPENEFTTAKRLKIKALNEQIRELYLLPDAELSKKLVELADRAWSDFTWRAGNELSKEHRMLAFGALIFDIIPRLTCILNNRDAGPYELAALKGFAQDVISHDALEQINEIMLNNTETPTAFELLFNDIVNGNPVDFAIDRLTRDVEMPEKIDLRSQFIHKISILRGLPGQFFWTPAMHNCTEENQYDDVYCNPHHAFYLTGASDAVQRYEEDQAKKLSCAADDLLSGDLTIDVERQGMS